MFACLSVCLRAQDKPVTGRQADVVQAAYIASEIAHRMVTVGGEVSHKHHKHARSSFDVTTLVLKQN